MTTPSDSGQTAGTQSAGPQPPTIVINNSGSPLARMIVWALAATGWLLLGVAVLTIFLLQSVEFDERTD